MFTTLNLANASKRVLLLKGKLVEVIPLSVANRACSVMVVMVSVHCIASQKLPMEQSAIPARRHNSVLVSLTPRVVYLEWLLLVTASTVAIMMQKYHAV